MYLPYVLVFARNPSEVERYRAKMGYQPNQVRWVRDQKTLMGLHIENRPVRMPWVGRFWERIDAPEIEEYSKVIGIDIIAASDSGIYDPRVVE